MSEENLVTQEEFTQFITIKKEKEGSGPQGQQNQPISSNIFFSRKGKDDLGPSTSKVTYQPFIPIKYLIYIDDHPRIVVVRDFKIITNSNTFYSYKFRGIEPIEEAKQKIIEHFLKDESENGGKLELEFIFPNNKEASIKVTKDEIFFLCEDGDGIMSVPLEYFLEGTKITSK